MLLLVINDMKNLLAMAAGEISFQVPETLQEFLAGPSSVFDQGILDITDRISLKEAGTLKEFIANTSKSDTAATAPAAAAAA